MTEITTSLKCGVFQLPRNYLPADPAESQAKRLIHSFLELRQKKFTEEMDWQVWLVKKKNDADQYDQFDTLYVLAYDEDLRVRAGARLLPTDRGSASPAPVDATYMIKDAALGKLNGLPSDLLEGEPPCSSKVWELTRLVSDGTPQATPLVLDALNQFLVSVGAEKCLFLGPRVIARLARSAGFRPRPLGRPSGNKDGSFQVFECDVVYPNPTAA